MMGYRTPNIDRVANEGVAFTDFNGQQSWTAGPAAFICGQNPLRTGLTKVGMPGATVGLQPEDPTIAGRQRSAGEFLECSICHEPTSTTYATIS
jgi:arylsulfatase A-like enzyme